MIPSDLEIRNQSLNPRQSFIVEAPAGSGKTELLIQRYLKLLGGVSQPEEILAMTFTRKAAGEMKGRIIEALNLAQDVFPPKKEPDKTTWNLAQIALERNKKFGWRLLENPARLRVVTIDSFCLFLTKRTPLLSKKDIIHWSRRFNSCDIRWMKVFLSLSKCSSKTRTNSA